MSFFPTPSSAVVETDGSASPDDVHPAPPPGTRDACPTTENSFTSGDLWGSRLGFRGGGRTAAPTPCRPAENPFAGHRVESLAFRGNGVSKPYLCRRLEELGGRAAIVGPKGSGKTTLLEELGAILPGTPVNVRIEASSRRPWSSARAQLPRNLCRDHVVLIDGSEQLGPVGWCRLLRATRNAGALIATHHRSGRLPTLIECGTKPTLLRNLVEELVPKDATLLAPHLEDLFERHRGDIRLCFRELYDLYAGRTSFES